MIPRHTKVNTTSATRNTIQRGISIGTFPRVEKIVAHISTMDQLLLKMPQEAENHFIK